jgi:acetyltransferase-like isoleucine patch superfamily enzyme
MKKNFDTIKKIIEKIWNKIDFYFFCLSSKEKYLRKKGVIIGDNCEIITDIKNFGSEPYLISIGERVTVTSGVKFITHDASTRLFRNKYSDMNRYGNLFGRIVIGSNCFIGVNTILLPETLIGDNCIIGAGSILKGKFPNNSVIVGAPARIIMSLDDYIEKVRQKMIPLSSNTREELKKELEYYFKGQL